jgi:lipooligosaccharide transport system permease protein
MRSSSWQVVEYQFLATKKSWRALIVGGLLTPLLYVLSLGVGLGTVVDRHSGLLGGVPYLQFVAPAFLAAAAVQIGASMATYPILTGFKWAPVFHGMAATPLTPRQICTGQLTWIGIRLAANSAIYLAVIALAGGLRSWWSVLDVPLATLGGAALAAPVVTMSAFMDSGTSAFNVLTRFVVTPMFLFSGTFYPVSQLPEWVRWLAYATPLYHCTALCRDAAIGGADAGAVAVHLAYLIALLGAGVVAAQWRFRVRLTR